MKQKLKLNHTNDIRTGDCLQAQSKRQLKEQFKEEKGGVSWK